MKEILIKGSISPAVVDDEDYDLVSQYSWTSHPGINTSYAMRPGGLYMHRDIFPTRPGNYVDHINGNGLDNRRCNLREATPGQSCSNAVKRDGCKSPYKGVCRAEGRRRWTAYINYGGFRDYLGQFDTQEEAAVEYNRAAKILYGEFARLNVI